MTSAFLWGAFQQDAFQIDQQSVTPCSFQDYVTDGYVDGGFVCGEATTTTQPGGVGNRRRKKVIINDKFYELNDIELKDALQTIITERPDEVVQPKKKKALRASTKAVEVSTKDIPQVIAEYPDLTKLYEQIAHHNRTREILQQIAWERYIETDDEEILLLAL